MSHFPLEKLSENRAWFWPAAAVVITSFVVLAYGFMEQHDEAQDMEDARVAAERQDRQAELQRKALQDQCGGPESSVVENARGGYDCFDTNGKLTKTIHGLARPVSQGTQHAARVFGARLQPKFECANSTPAGMVPVGFLKG